MTEDEHKITINCDGYILVDEEEFKRLQQIEFRIRMKIRQLEDEARYFDDLGGFGTEEQDMVVRKDGINTNRKAYITALRFAIMQPFGEV